MTPFQGIIRGRKIFYHTTVYHSTLPVLRREETYRRSLSGGRMDFRKEEDDSRWSHFVISTSPCEYQTSISLVPAALRVTSISKKKKGRKSTRGEERINGIEIARFHTQNIYSAHDTLFFRRYFSEVDFFFDISKGGNIFTRSRLVVRDTT